MHSNLLGFYPLPEYLKLNFIPSLRNMWKPKEKPHILGAITDQKLIYYQKSNIGEPYLCRLVQK